jgi:LPS sulfotransferase NodH
MKLNERLILLAWPRSGSSSLWQILQAHPDLRLFPDEPFNENFADWSPGNPDYLARVRDTDSLDAVLTELFECYRGIKVLSYQLDEELLRHLILRPDLRIIFISRRNLLQIAVSDRIAKQTRVWNRWDANPERPLEQYYESLEPLDLDDLRSYVRELAPHLHWIESVLNLRKGSHTLRLRYEDLYFAPREAQRAQLSAVWSFLGLPPPGVPEADYYLDPQTAKLGGRKTYGLLPNAAEIDAALGADETGWLFPLAPFPQAP